MYNKFSLPSRVRAQLRNSYQLYLFSVPTIIYFLIFDYLPMVGLQLAFKKVDFGLGMFGGEFIGFDNFVQFMTRPNFWLVIKNTFMIAFSTLIIGFPIPIILALLLNEVTNTKFKKFVQTITYAPYFISVVVLVGMLTLFLSPTIGVVNQLISVLGNQKINFLLEPGWFVTVYVVSHIWQHAGWGSIIYLSVLAGIDQDQNEAAIVEGASRFQRIVYINIPSLLPFIVILFILASGQVMNVGFEKVFLMQNPMNMQSSDVISTYVYRMGIQTGEYGFSTAVGLFNSIVNFSILIFVNHMSKRLNQSGLF